MYFIMAEEMSQVFETFKGLSLSHLQKLPKPVFPLERTLMRRCLFFRFKKINLFWLEYDKMKAYKHDKAIKWLEKHYVQAKSNLFILSFV